jgi:hypothetical protein
MGKNTSNFEKSDLQRAVQAVEFSPAIAAVVSYTKAVGSQS